MLDDIGKQTVRNTSDWTLFDWKRFRSFNRYWTVKDSAYRDIAGEGDGFKQGRIRDFRRWKLEAIKQYKKF